MDFSHGPDVVDQVESVPDGEDVEERAQHGVEHHGDDVGEKLAVVESVGRIWKVRIVLTVICGYSDTFPTGLNCSRT